MAACRVLAEFLGALTATNARCKGIIKAGKWFRDISCQNLSQSKGSTRRKSAPCADCTRFSLHFHFTSTVLSNPGIAITQVSWETFLLQMEVTLAKLVLLVYFIPVPQLKQAVLTKARSPIHYHYIHNRDFFRYKILLKTQIPH